MPTAMKITLSIAITAVICGIGGFFGGAQYQKTHTKVAATPGFNQPVGGVGGQRPTGTNGSRMGAGTGFRPVSGEITGLSGSTVTVVDSNGTASTVKVSNSTEVSQTTTGSLSDLQTGDQVLVMGSQSSDGSIAAESIQLNPANTFGAGALPNGVQ
jgi:hypothetical protein